MPIKERKMNLRGKRGTPPPYTADPVCFSLTHPNPCELQGTMVPVPKPGKIFVRATPLLQRQQIIEDTRGRGNRTNQAGIPSLPKVGTFGMQCMQRQGSNKREVAHRDSLREPELADARPTLRKE